MGSPAIHGGTSAHNNPGRNRPAKPTSARPASLPLFEEQADGSVRVPARSYQAQDRPLCKVHSAGKSAQGTRHRLSVLTRDHRPVTIVARRAIDPDLRYLQSSRAVRGDEEDSERDACTETARAPAAQSYSDRAALRLAPMEPP
jgi:hypothetical protein